MQALTFDGTLRLRNDLPIPQPPPGVPQAMKLSNSIIRPVPISAAIAS
jgi:hypothetical protein